MQIEIISGSPREQSVTRRGGLHLKKRLEAETPHSVGLIDLKDYELPMVQTVFNSVDNTPEPFRPLSRRIFAAEAFILVTPEYNGSYSPAMKNLLDHFPKQLHKPFGLVTASPGPLGGLRASQQLLLLVAGLFGIASPTLLIVPNVEKKFDAEGNLADESFQKNVHMFLTEYLWLADQLAGPKTQAD